MKDCRAFIYLHGTRYRCSGEHSRGRHVHAAIDSTNEYFVRVEWRSFKSMERERDVIVDARVS